LRWPTGATNDKTFQYAVGCGAICRTGAVADPGVPNLIADMNSQKLEFSPRRRPGRKRPTGNLPSVICDNVLDSTALGWLNSFDAPAMFTSGDND
jgi:hypothetical protein